MKILPFLLLSIFFLLALSACYKGAGTDATAFPAFFNPVRPGAMQVGQKSRYLMLRGQHYFDQNNYDQFEYLPDTLIVEITAQNGPDFTFKEYFTNGSAPVGSGSYVVYQSNALTYLARVENDTFKTILNGAQSSRLFRFGKVALPLAHFSSNPTSIQGWKTTLPVNQSFITAYTTNYNLFEKVWPFLDIMIDNKYLALDGPGATYIYESQTGIARTSSYSTGALYGYGFDFLP
ncbi:MAG: hypothetical protein WCR52_15600 [Bacteroidota bacterium]